MKQLDIFGPPPPNNAGKFSISNGEYQFYPFYFNKTEADYFLSNLLNSIEWIQESMNMYGKQVLFPRLTAWYGDIDKPYSFSGIKLNPHLWTDDLLEIKKRISAYTDVSFNSVLLNRYRSGNDSISWHTDAEPELGKNPVIASVNFGATRKFQLRHVITKEKLEIELMHGSLLIMQGELQHYWQHQVPKTSKPVGERVNLTFRVIK
jgi:alkylated DNA repair dioxygenase AlkB